MKNQSFYIFRRVAVALMLLSFSVLCSTRVMACCSFTDTVKVKASILTCNYFGSFQSVVVLRVNNCLPFPPPMPFFGTCVAAVQLKAAAIASIDAFALVVEGTDTPLGGFAQFVPNVNTSNQVQALSPASAGNTWFGFAAQVPGPVPPTGSGEFLMQITLNPGYTAQDLLDCMAMDPDDMLFTDEGDAAGNPTFGHDKFVTWGIIEFEPVTVTATADTTICAGQQVVLSADASGGHPPYSYFWSNNATNSSTAVSPANTTQ